mgnify:CR=1 FL=1
MNWWSPKYDEIVKQLPSSIVKLLKKRIESTKIRGRTCQLNEECWELQDLFEKELETYKRKKLRISINHVQNQEQQPKPVECVVEKKDELVEKLEAEIIKLNKDKDGLIEGAKKLNELNNEVVDNYERQLRDLRQELSKTQVMIQRMRPKETQAKTTQLPPKLLQEVRNFGAIQGERA